MQFTNVPEVRRVLAARIEFAVARINKGSRDCQSALDAGDEKACLAASEEMLEGHRVVAQCRELLHLLDTNTFKLSNRWGHWLVRLAGQNDPKSRPCNLQSEPQEPLNLSDKAVAMLRTEEPALQGALLTLVQQVLGTIKVFDDWMEEKCRVPPFSMEWTPGGIDDEQEFRIDASEYTRTLQGLVTMTVRLVMQQYHTLFGRPGFLDSLPDWVRELVVHEHS